MKTIVLTVAAAKQLDALPLPAQDDILRALDRYATGGHGDVKRLQGRDGYRLRVGRYRVLFDEDKTTILAVYVGKRETTTYR
jgi:mRNA interferase RelE/StbE